MYNAAEIVEDQHRKTEKPVAFEVIVGELGKYRRFINPSSGLMAISLNPALKQISPGRFVPKRFCRDANGEAESKHLDRILALERDILELTQEALQSYKHAETQIWKGDDPQMYARIRNSI